MKYYVIILVLILMSLSAIRAQHSPILYDFSGETAESNGVIIMGAGFGSYPIADTAFGPIPADNAFDGATDGRGMIVTAGPGEGVMILTQPDKTPNAALLRCSVRANAPHLSLYLASIDLGESEYVSTMTLNNPISFVNRYKRIADFFLPPSTEFQGLIQIVNTSDTEQLTVYLDNFEIIELEHDRIEVAMKDVVGEG